ncbi:hypothetical protein [Pedobacter sp. UC225_65]|uniref:hypothetical protein n=1 Tax=Pedobacter sp. UC225_65 TaxID=3350173 RepID=UPI00366BE89D
MENLARVKEETNTIKQLLVFNNDKAQLPIVKLTGLNIASVGLGFQYTSVFDSIANKFTKVEQLAKSYNSESISSLNLLNDDLKLYNCVILKTSKPLSKGLVALVTELEKTKQVILVLNGTYQKSGFSTFRSPVIISPTNSAIGASCLAQFIFGAIVTNGKAIRLKYSVPEEVGINSDRS